MICKDTECKPLYSLAIVVNYQTRAVNLPWAEKSYQIQGECSRSYKLTSEIKMGFHIF